ncbi:hypothetical protein VTJ83DRAFT_1540 [Remersonia thermophila]|uniref:Uncharacterized protein n=1 Tax=Remersonia thermophila TaxID=72144 RepID=A0ABR4DG93_9PEZI
MNAASGIDLPAPGPAITHPSSNHYLAGYQNASGQWVCLWDDGGRVCSDTPFPATFPDIHSLVVHLRITHINVAEVLIVLWCSECRRPLSNCVCNPTYMLVWFKCCYVKPVPASDPPFLQRDPKDIRNGFPSSGSWYPGSYGNRGAGGGGGHGYGSYPSSSFYTPGGTPHGGYPSSYATRTVGAESSDASSVTTTSPPSEKAGADETLPSPPAAYRNRRRQDTTFACAFPRADFHLHKGERDDDDDDDNTTPGNSRLRPAWPPPSRAMRHALPEAGPACGMAVIVMMAAAALRLCRRCVAGRSRLGDAFDGGGNRNRLLDDRTPRLILEAASRPVASEG